MSISVSGPHVWLARRATVACLVLALCGCKDAVDLHTGMTDAEANRVVAALREDGIAVTKRMEKAGVAVRVPESELARATAVLKAQGLPHRPAARMGEVFKKEGLISSPLEERARYIYALSQELETTLGEIDGVLVARVHLVLPEKVAPGEPLQPPSAAVFVKHLPSLEPDSIGPRIRQLVARSVPGMGALTVDRVSVVFVVAEAVPQRRVPLADHTNLLLWLGTVLVSLVGALVVALVGKSKGFWRLPRKPSASTPAAASKVA